MQGLRPASPDGSAFAERVGEGGWGGGPQLISGLVADTCRVAGGGSNTPEDLLCANSTQASFRFSTFSSTVVAKKHMKKTGKPV